jgi:hypothetical protein
MKQRHLLFALSAPSLVLGCGSPSSTANTSSPSSAPQAASSGVASAKTDSSARATTAGASGTGDATPFAKHALPPPSQTVGAFLPTTNGFKFQNYGNDKSFTNLTSYELRRMFGDKVCARVEGADCTLTPAAESWMTEMNKSMGGGHCEGFAALSLLMERGQIDPTQFGAPTPYALDIDGNEKLQREIAYWFVTQNVMPMASAEIKTLTPNEVVDKLRDAIKSGSESYTLGIYQPEYKAGHATTPYAIAEKENGVLWIMQYDNNYPGEERHIEIDTKANTWAYTTAADPNGAESGYKGDADTKTLTIAPSSIRTGSMVCDFCGDVDAPAAADASKGSAPGEAPYREIMMVGDGSLLITDDQGKRLGYANGKLVNEIAGAVFAADKSDKSAAEDDDPSYFVPPGHALKVALNGSDAKDSSSDVVLVGPGYTLGVEGIALAKGQSDEVAFSKDWSEIQYTTKKNEAPTILLGIETTSADYTFELNVAGDGDGQVITVALDVAKGSFALNVDGGPAKSDFAVAIERTDKTGTQVFKHKGLDVGASQVARFEYGAWKGDKAPLHVDITDKQGKVVLQEDESDEK